MCAARILAGLLELGGELRKSLTGAPGRSKKTPRGGRKVKKKTPELPVVTNA